MSIPNKILWLLGYNNLAFILEQERQHWLLKTDKKKQIQDKITGDMFQGQIDNIGSDIILNTEKLPITNNAVVSITYATTGISRILQLQSSAFTYSSCVNGLMFARIISSSYPVIINGEIQYKNYKLQMTNCVKCIIPFAGSNNSSDVFAGEWIKTNTPPSILMMDNKGQYTIEESLSFNGATNCTWYYPLTKTLQPIDLVKNTSTTYTTSAVNNDGLIGYPLYWFTCDETDIGPTISIENNTNENNDEYFFVANEGDASKYNAKIYTGISGDKGTPTGESTSNFQIRVECEDDYSFTNTKSDFNIPIKVSSISLYDTTNDVDYNVGMTIDGESSYVTMTKNDAWTYIDESHYSIEMSVFDVNGSTTSPLISVFDVYFDQSIPFENTTTDIGFAGIRLGSSNISSDIYPRYPYNLSDWDGLPEWMNDISNEGQVDQHSCIYAIHNTPTYDESNPSSRQVAALLLDPGKAITENSDETTENDERGRVYVLSNDEAIYENNSTSTYPKPARTVARICDIPTSVVQLSGLSGIAPTNVVDKKYVRSEASYTEADKNRLYNVLIDKWIKPSHLDENGKPITDRVDETNDFVFNTLDGLNSVDMINHNDVRIYENLNQLINPEDVVLGNIHTPGSGYQINDIGVIVVGGFGFNYSVTAIDSDGGVTDVEIIPTNTININLSNFDMPDDTESGYTEPYGTSPITGNGTGLKLRFLIKDYKSKATTRGEIVDGLYALVKEFDGLWMYEYIINQTSSTTPKTGVWTKQTLIAESDNSSHSVDEGLSIKDSYLTMNIPILHDIEIFKTNSDKTISEFTNIKAYTTSNFINIVDTDHSPYVVEGGDSSVIPVDINGYTAYHVGYCFAKKHTVADAINAIEDTGKIIDDCFVLWRWNGTNKEQTYQNCLSVVFVVVRHKFANLLSNDSTSILSKNNLKYKKYVNSNSSTTVVWNDSKVGPMVWVYNPISPILETYVLDKHGDINVSRNQYNWSDIQFPYNANESDKDVDLPRLVDDDGKLNWNVATNKREYVTPDTSEYIYQQPKLINVLTFGTTQGFQNIRPIGQWQLVLPRTESYTLTNGSKTVTPVRLTTLSGNNIGNPGMLTDSNGNDVRNKTMIIDNTTSGVKLRLFNSTKELWDEI